MKAKKIAWLAIFNIEYVILLCQTVISQLCKYLI